MSEMVKRVAAALRQAIESSVHNFGEAGVDALYNEAARAAIAAMREPTEGMVAAAHPLYPMYDDAHEAHEDVYDAMIAAALDDPE